MNHKMILVAVASLCWIWGQAMAQTLAPGVHTKAASIAQSPAISHHPVTSPNIHSVNIILRQQMRQIQKDRKSGKLTEAQARTAWENVKNVRREELEFFKQNSQKEITSDQKNHLLQEINQNKQ